MQVVVNSCYGGFGLSDEANTDLQLEKNLNSKGIKPTCPKCGSKDFTTSNFLYIVEECRECKYYYVEE